MQPGCAKVISLLRIMSLPAWLFLSYTSASGTRGTSATSVVGVDILGPTLSLYWTVEVPLILSEGVGYELLSRYDFRPYA